ncbi:hypothetical protein G7Y89_g15065 [Cudoniella acicularis]|uniref:Uncharacterized protein n=1 Tax=Cudoniella acicularis TaxID=354080 RepID=A0A8H4VR74_9HELO|nr:hypothetical protein G7Y89_g15065 [Cudoniella acicularis]
MDANFADDDLMNMKPEDFVNPQPVTRRRSKKMESPAPPAPPAPTAKFVATPAHKRPRLSGGERSGSSTPRANSATPRSGDDTPTSGRIDLVSVGPSKHTVWEPLSVHTAKCDGCSKHNTAVIQRCVRCNRQLCKNCIVKVADDGIHVVNMDELKWDFVTPKRATTRVSKTDKLPGTATFHINDLVTPTAPAASTAPENQLDGPKAAKRPRISDQSQGRKVPLRKEAINNLRKRAVQIDDEDDTPKRYTPIRTPNQPTSKRAQPLMNMESSGSSDLEEELMSDDRLDRLYEADHARRERGERGSARLRDVPEQAPEKLGRSQPNVWTRNNAPEQAHNPAQRFGVPTQNAATVVPGATFDEVISNLDEVRREKRRETDQKRIEEEKARAEEISRQKEEAFREDQDRAWATNTTIQNYLEQGQVQEAKDMFKAASALMRAKRGLPPKKGSD